MVIGGVFDSVMGPSSGPAILIFKRFQSFWPNIVQSEYSTAASDPEMYSTIIENKASLLELGLSFLKENQPREDYKELLELVVVFLGGTTHQRNIYFRKPGAMHRARWMAKVIYSLKIWMFHSQFKMTAREIKAVGRVVRFAVLVYFKAWFQATLAVQAPANDLLFLKKLSDFEIVDKQVSGVACHKFIRHLLPQ